MTFAQAAVTLHVSEAYVLMLVESGELPFYDTDGYPVLSADDVLRYKAADDARRKRIADELTAESQAFGLDY